MIKHNGFVFETNDEELILKFNKNNLIFAFENKEEYFDYESGLYKYRVANKEKFFESFMKKFLHKISSNNDYEDFLIYCDDVFDELVDEWCDGIEEKSI